MRNAIKPFWPLLILLTFLLGACTNPFFAALLGEKEKSEGGFTPHTDTSTANDAATLGFIGTRAVSSGAKIATVEIVDGKIAITSVAAGTTAITVSANGYTSATIPVTVADDGTITVGAITRGAFVPVTRITRVPTAGTAGQNLTLTGTVVPANAANKTIEWTVKTAGTTGAAISGDTLSTTETGIVVLTATIANGLAEGTVYTQDFSIRIFTTPAQYREMVLATPDVVSPITITGDRAYGDSGNGSGNSVFPAGRTVTLSPFTIAKYETTYELWYEVKRWAIDDARGTDKYTFANPGRAGKNGGPGAPPAGNKLEPVTYINWRDAVVWCNAYSEMIGKEPVYYTDATYTTVLRISATDDGIKTTADGAKMKPEANGYRLPTEAEWEYAARGGGTPSTDKWAGTSDQTDLENYAWYSGNANSDTHPVGKKKANGLGLHDMSGNVWEWCWDWYGTISTEPVTDPVGPGPDWPNRINRGGAWKFDASYCAVSFRSSYGPAGRENDLGFRVVCRD